MQWVYTQGAGDDRGVFTVGYYRPPTSSVLAWEWVAVMDYGEEAEAQRMVNYLNGGEGKGLPKRIG